MPESDYEVGAPPPRRSRPANASAGRVSPLIAAGRPAPEPEYIPEAIEQSPTDVVGPAPVVTPTPPPAPQQPVTAAVTSPTTGQQAAVTAAAPEAPALEPDIQVPLRKKTIAFPVDLWRYAGLVFNATDEEEHEVYFQEFIWSAVRREIARREVQHNEGQPFDGSSRLRRGRRRSLD
jgi:hypothetical protein